MRELDRERYWLHIVHSTQVSCRANTPLPCLAQSADVGCSGSPHLFPSRLTLKLPTVVPVSWPPPTARLQHLPLPEQQILVWTTGTSMRSLGDLLLKPTGACMAFFTQSVSALLASPDSLWSQNLFTCSRVCYNQNLPGLPMSMPIRMYF